MDKEAGAPKHLYWKIKDLFYLPFSFISIGFDVRYNRDYADVKKTHNILEQFGE